MSAALKPAAARKRTPKKSAAKPAPVARDQRAAEMLREIRAKGDALTDRIDRLLNRLA